MDAIRCDKEEKQHYLKTCECDIRCDKQGGGGAWCEDGLKEIGEEGRHYLLGRKMKSMCVEGTERAVRNVGIAG